MSENNQGGVIYRKSRMAITSNGHHIKLGEKEAFEINEIEKKYANNLKFHLEWNLIISLGNNKENLIKILIKR